MSFSDFQSIEQVIRKYPLKVVQQRFLPEVETELPDWLMENLKFSLDMKSVDENEAFFAENFIYPFLHQAWKQHRRLKVWSHRAISYDKELFGEPDYLVSALADEITNELVTKPLLAVTEAKKEDFTKGWGQCLVELLTCQKINNNENITIYGIVSTGIFWEFGKLEGKVFTKHTLPHSVSEPKKVYGILEYIFDECEKTVTNAKVQ